MEVLGEWASFAPTSNSSTTERMTAGTSEKARPTCARAKANLWLLS